MLSVWLYLLVVQAGIQAPAPGPLTQGFRGQHAYFGTAAAEVKLPPLMSPGSTAVPAAPPVSRQPQLPASPPSDRVTLGIVAAGLLSERNRMQLSAVKSLAGAGRVDVAAIAAAPEVAGRLASLVGANTSPALHSDVRMTLENKKLDAILLIGFDSGQITLEPFAGKMDPAAALAVAFIWSCQAGKDVYVFADRSVWSPSASDCFRFPQGRCRNAPRNDENPIAVARKCKRVAWAGNEDASDLGLFVDAMLSRNTGGSITQEPPGQPFDGQGAGSGGQPGTQPARLAKPGPLTKEFRREGVSFRYPDNWQEYPLPAGIWIAPPEARTTIANREAMTDGLFFHVFRPNKPMSLDAAIETVTQPLRKVIPDVGRRPETWQLRQAGGRPCKLMCYRDRNKGTATFIVVDGGGVFPYWTMYAQASNSEEYSPIFQAVLDSIHVETSTRLQDRSFTLRHLHGLTDESQLHLVTLSVGPATMTFEPHGSCMYKRFVVALEGIEEVEFRKSHLNIRLRDKTNKRFNFDLFDSAATVQRNAPVPGPDALRDLSAIRSYLLTGIERRKAAVAEATRLEAERRALPAGLTASVQFDDSRSAMPSNRLEAGKKAELVVSLKNEGPGAGYGVVVAASADRPQVKLSAPEELGEIPPGKGAEIRMPIEAGLDLPDGEVRVTIEANEKRGYHARKVQLAIPTVRLIKPALSIETYEINDGTSGLARGNGNGVPESGETIEMLVFVKNSGPGPAAAATLSVDGVDSGIEVLQKEAPLGLIEPNRAAQGKLVFGIPRTWSGKALNVRLRAMDARGEMAGVARRELALGVTARAPVLATSSRILSLGKEIQELTNDQTADFEVTPENSGTLDATEVTLHLAAPGAVLQRSQAQIGLLRAAEKAPPQRFELTLPRSFGKDQLLISVELSQKDFPSQTKLQQVPIKRRMPTLAAAFTVAGRHGGKAIEQNETADLEVRIVNNGQLAAQDAQADIKISAPGVEVLGPKSARLGLIAPNDQGVARFRLHLLRSVPPGELPIQLTVAQADFAPLNETLRLDVRPEQAVVQRVAPAVQPAPSVARRPPPMIFLARPQDGEYVGERTIELAGMAVDGKGISRVHVSVNEKPAPQEAIQQGLKRRPAGAAGGDEVDLRVRVSLEPGSNSIVVSAYNVENERAEITRTVHRLEERAGTAAAAAPALVPHADVDRFILGASPARPDSRRWAVVIGIEQYRRAPRVAFATRDAYAMREYAIRLLGVPSEQVLLLVDDQATKAEMQVLLEERLQQLIRAGDTVYVYFAGHGAPEVKTRTAYLLPADGNPQSLRLTGYSLKDFYAALGQLKADRVLVFLDACFSGLVARGKGSEMLLAEARPGVIEVDNPAIVYENVVSFAAAQNDQLSNAYNEAAHGLFTYFLLKGLGGGATAASGQLSLSGLAQYVKDQVNRTSRQLFGENQHQTPVVNPEINSRQDMILVQK